MLAHFNCWWKDKIHFALGWLPCLLMLITSQAKHFRGHLERSRDLNPPDRTFLMLLPFQGNIVGSEISVCTSAEWVPTDSKGCCTMEVMIQSRMVVVLLTARFLHAHLLIFALVQRSDWKLTAFTTTFIGYKAEEYLAMYVHLYCPLGSFVASSSFCSTPGSFFVSAN